MSKVEGNPVIDAISPYVKPYARTAQLGGAAGVLFGLMFVSSAPSFLQRFRWKVGLPLTAISFGVAYLGDRVLNQNSQSSRDSTRRKLVEEGFSTPSKIRSGRFKDREREHYKKQIAKLTKGTGVDLQYLLEENHRSTLSEFTRLGTWLESLSALSPSDVLTLSQTNSLVFRSAEETILFQVMHDASVMGPHRFFIAQPQPNTLRRASSNGDGHFEIVHKAARQHCQLSNTKHTMSLEAFCAPLLHLLAEAWKGQAKVEVVKTEDRLGVSVEIMETLVDVKLLQGGAPTDSTLNPAKMLGDVSGALTFHETE